MRITPDWLHEGWGKLQADPLVAPYLAEQPVPDLNQPEDLFEDIVSSIVYQQLSGKAAATIYGRFLGLFPGSTKPVPELLAVMDIETLRGVGLSRQKASYVTDLAQRVSSGTLPITHLHELSDQEVHEHLTQVKGIGPWTADMMLIFALHRPDVFPVLDLGVRKGLQKVLGREDNMNAPEMLEASERWRGYRSAASLAMWRILDVKTVG